MVTSSYTDIPSDMCLDYHLIQQDSGLVLLDVNVTADPCPQASWSRRAPGDTVATEVTAETSDITVSCVIVRQHPDPTTKQIYLKCIFLLRSLMVVRTIH